MATSNLFKNFDERFNTAAHAEEIKEARNTTTGNFKSVPVGKYEVEVNKMELGESKAKDPMVSIWFKVLEGEYKGSIIFFNQVLILGHAWFHLQMHTCDDLLRDLAQNTDIGEIEFFNYDQYGNLIMDIFEAIDGKFGYVLDYSEDKKGFSKFAVEEAFEFE